MGEKKERKIYAILNFQSLKIALFVILDLKNRENKSDRIL